VVQQL